MIIKLPSLSIVEWITDTRNTDQEISVFKYLKTIERSKQQNLYSPFLYQPPYAHMTKKKKKKKKTLPSLLYYIMKGSDYLSNYYNQFKMNSLN